MIAMQYPQVLFRAATARRDGLMGLRELQEPSASLRRFARQRADVCLPFPSHLDCSAYSPCHSILTARAEPSTVNAPAPATYETTFLATCSIKTRESKVQADQMILRTCGLSADLTMALLSLHIG